VPGTEPDAPVIDVCGRGQFHIRDQDLAALVPELKLTAAVLEINVI
jgi:hypothetical protein